LINDLVLGAGYRMIYELLRPKEDTPPISGRTADRIADSSGAGFGHRLRAAGAGSPRCSPPTGALPVRGAARSGVT